MTKGVGERAWPRSTSALLRLTSTCGGVRVGVRVRVRVGVRVGVGIGVRVRVRVGVRLSNCGR